MITHTHTHNYIIRVLQVSFLLFIILREYYELHRRASCHHNPFFNFKSLKFFFNFKTRKKKRKNIRYLSTKPGEKRIRRRPETDSR